MHPDYKLLIFDWDGTLANSIGRIVEAMHVASDRMAFARCDDLAVKGIIGLGLPEAIRSLYPEIDDNELVVFASITLITTSRWTPSLHRCSMAWRVRWRLCVPRAITWLSRPARLVAGWIECSSPMVGRIISISPVLRTKPPASRTR